MTRDPIVCYACGAEIVDGDEHRPGCKVPELIAFALDAAREHPRGRIFLPTEARDVPTHCAWCGAYLQGGATKHQPDCWVPQIAASVGRPIEHFEEEARHFMPLPECTCRTCGHVASSHIHGICFECGRAACWS